MNELQVISKLGKIEWNADEFKTGLEGYVERFKNLAVSEDNLKDMEKDKKILASLRIKLDKFRKATKADFERPLRDFEMEIKSLQDVISDVELPLNDQLKKYELDRVNAERIRIRDLAKEIAVHAGLRDEYFFDFIIKPEWTNRTAAKGKTMVDITAAIDQLKQKQDLIDQQKQLDTLKQQNIDMLCQSVSEIYGLNTPITAQDCRHATKDCALADLPAAIKKVAQGHADIEAALLKAMQPAIQTPVIQPWITSDSPIGNRYNVTIFIENIPEDRLLQLRQQISDIKYDIRQEAAIVGQS